MSFDSSKLYVGTRPQLLDFILWESDKPQYPSRKLFPAVAGVKIGDTIKADGTKTNITADIAAIALTSVPEYMAGLTREGDLKVVGLVGNAEVKMLPSWARVQVNGIEALGIDIHPTSL